AGRLGGPGDDGDSAGKRHLPGLLLQTPGVGGPTGSIDQLQPKAVVTDQIGEHRGPALGIRARHLQTPTVLGQPGDVALQVVGPVGEVVESRTGCVPDRARLSHHQVDVDRSLARDARDGLWLWYAVDALEHAATRRRRGPRDSKRLAQITHGRGEVV